jgi:sugar/nucleoside kinase (ribokinase family)
MTRDITVVGPLNIDLLIVGEGPDKLDTLPTWDGPADMEMTAAGSVGYNASDLAKLGLDVMVCSCVPDDPLGSFIIEALSRDGVDTSEIQVVANSLTGIGVYMLLFGNRKRPLIYRLPNHKPWPQSFTPDKINKLLNSKMLHCGGYLHFKDVWHGVTIEIFQEAQKRGLITALDPQFPLFTMEAPWLIQMKDIIQYVDILFCDETEARKMTALENLDDCAQKLLSAGPEVVIVKQGANGATVYKQGWKYHQPSIKPEKLVDSIGAGDAFDAGFLFATLQDWPLEKRTLFASIAAGYTISGVGGSNSFPTRNLIEKKMEKYR